MLKKQEASSLAPKCKSLISVRAPKLSNSSPFLVTGSQTGAFWGLKRRLPSSLVSLDMRTEVSCWTRIPGLRREGKHAMVVLGIEKVS